MTAASRPARYRFVAPAAAGLLAALGIGGALFARAARKPPTPEETVSRLTPNSTGKVLQPQGEQTAVGSFPNHLLLSPDGKYIVVSDSGSRSFLSVLDAASGKLVSQAGFNDQSTYGRGRAGLYYGLAFGPKNADGGVTLYAARGVENVVSILHLAPDGKVTDTGRVIASPDDTPADKKLKIVAGIAVTPDGGTLIAANNSMKVTTEMDSTVTLADTASGAVKATVPVPGYPLAVSLLRNGTKAYVGSEQLPVISVIDPKAGTVRKTIAVGSHPMAFAFDAAQKRLFVANANSDTISIIETAGDTVNGTILLRPTEIGGLTGETPTGVALAPDEKTLYVSLGDMNAVAVVDIAKRAVRGYIPVGWYPTSLVVSPDGKRLFVANAKGVAARTPNNVPFPAAVAAGNYKPQYIQSVLEGTVSTISIADAARNLPSLTRLTLAANHFYAGLPAAAKAALTNPGIQHVIYIIKENRTYDQVLGDLPQGNGDKSLVMFGRDVTPNLHALAERFVLLDNFYCCSEVSADGWNWSTAGMANEFTERNVPYSYTGRSRPYDFEGSNTGVPVDRFGVPDAATPASGYIWDQVAKAKMPFRNYGFFTDDFKMPRAIPEEGTEGADNAGAKKVLFPNTDNSFRQFDLEYMDSDAWVKEGITPFAKQKKVYGQHDAPSRVSEWRHEFDACVKSGILPRFQMLRLGTDHTQGTKVGTPTPQAYVADNDYAIGELVDAVSHSPFWKSTAIFVLEDDAQNGEDHVDAHRAPAYVISPFIRRATHDSRFYNTDSFLHTMECLMGLPPLNQYVAIAPTVAAFGSAPANDAPFDAILPNKTILSGRNRRDAYRAKDSARFFLAGEADAGPDDQMSDIVWHAVKGAGVPEPKPHYGLHAGDAGIKARAKSPDPD